MKLEQKALAEDLLVSEETCHGAVFCTYTFDPAYFEEQLLRCVLRLRGDPNEDAARYHAEAVQALQTTPVACMIDSSVRTGGRRLPYDLQLVRRRTFHPKVFLILYESEARLAVGSGNVTKSGLEQNTEVFFARGLRYDDPVDAATLREVDSFLHSCAELASGGHSQLDLVRSALACRIAPTPRIDGGRRPEAAFVSTFAKSLLARLGETLPVGATITRVGVMAPFFEADDLDAGSGKEGLGSVLAQLLALRPSAGAVFDVGVPWEDAPPAPPPGGSTPSLDAVLPSLWVWRKRDPADSDGPERLTYVVLDSVGERRVDATSASGAPCRLDRKELEVAAEARTLWRVTRPTVSAPKAILRRIAAERPTHLWLHPTTELTLGGGVRRRPLHAKVILVSVTSRGASRTYGYFGSANASCGALARAVEQMGNVEAGVLVRFDGEVTLHDVLPSLVRYRLECVDLVEREATAAPPDLSAWIDDVVHDAAGHSLRVSWLMDGPAPLGTWTIRYSDREIASGAGVPSEDTVVPGFDLDHRSAEVTFASAGGEWLLPIRVQDLTTLPVDPTLTSLGLAEILALLGRRVGVERLALLSAAPAPDGMTSMLEAVFGEGFGPTDVFKAWWGAVEDLRSSKTVASFRLRLLGPAGVRRAWTLLRDVTSEVLSHDEVWVYGCELLREIRGIEIPEGPDAAAKAVLLREFEIALVEDLRRTSPDPAGRGWLSEVERFYRIGGARGDS